MNNERKKKSIQKMFVSFKIPRVNLLLQLCVGPWTMYWSRLSAAFEVVPKFSSNLEGNKAPDFETDYIPLFIKSQKLVVTHFNYVLFIPALLIQSIQNFKDVWFSTMIVPAKEFHVKRKNSLC